ncbi:MAG: TerB family tellurite resistance protein [Puniceicoccales bacterium]
MKDLPLSLALARVVAVAAWADGEIQPEERDCWKDLVYLLPGINLGQWRRLQKLLDTPIMPAMQTRYINALAGYLLTEADRERAIYVLERMMRADGEICAEEAKLMKLFLAKFNETRADGLPMLVQLMDRPLEFRLVAASRVEQEFAPVSEVVAGRVEDWREGDLGFSDLSEAELRRLCLAGILIACVIQADDYIDERELAAAIDFLAKRWGLEREQAEFVMIVSLSDAFSQLDVLRVSRWLFEVTNLRERKAFLELLFEIASVDSELHPLEIEEIMQICANLHLDHVHFQRCLERIDAEKAS